MNPKIKSFIFLKNNPETILSMGLAASISFDYKRRPRKRYAIYWNMDDKYMNPWKPHSVITFSLKSKWEHF